VRPLTLSTMIALALTRLSLSAAEPSYFRDVRSVLQSNCQGCHQPNLKSSDLDLTTFEGLSAGGKHGPAPGVIVKYLSGEMKPQMPFGQPPLSAVQIDLVRNWIAAGAKDDTPAEARETISLDKPTVYLLPPVVTALAFSPDGKTLAVSGNREILIHSLDGSAPPKRLPGLSERILSLAFSGDGALLLAGGGMHGQHRADRRHRQRQGALQDGRPRKLGVGDRVRRR
jgi:mono/diheme cytochrome c family protein